MVFAPLTEPVALPTEVHRGGTVEKVVEDRRGDYGITKYRALFTIGLVGRDNERHASLTTLGDLVGFHIPERDMPHFVDYQKARGQVDTETPLQVVLGMGSPETVD